MMKFLVCAVLAVSFLSEKTMSQQQVWNPMFDEIQLTRKKNNSNDFEQVITFTFDDYWPPYPFRLDLSEATIAVFPKIKGPSSPDLVWDQNWFGEIWLGDSELTNKEMELVANFNKDTEYVLLPREKIGSNTKAVVRINGNRDGEVILYDQFYFTLSSEIGENAVSGGDGDGDTPPPPTTQIPCYTASISSPSRLFDYLASSGSFSVNSSRDNCVWNISKSGSWITVNGSNSRTGDSTIQYTISENTTNETRTGTITVGSQNFTVVQKAKQQEQLPPPSIEVPCYSTSLSESFKLFPTTGGSGTYTVSLNKSDCSWEIITDSNWISISGSRNRQGSSNITYTVSENETDNVRIGKISTSNQTHVVIQPPKEKTIIVPESPCHIEEISKSFSVVQDNGGSDSFSVETTKPDCVWAINTTSPWVIIKNYNTTTRVGNSQVEYTVSPNNTSSVRVGTINIGDFAHTVVQLPKEEIPIQPQEPQINFGLVNVVEENRTLSSTQLLIVNQDSVDPLIGLASAGPSIPINTTNGYIMAWGRNSRGQYGNDTREQLVSPTITINENIWTQVSSGSGHVAAVDKNGNLYTWGNNSYGELGTGDGRQRTVPTMIVFPSKRWKMVSCGSSHTIALTEDGEIYSWGRNIYGQLGIDSIRNNDTPQKVGNRSNWQYVFASGNQSYAIDSNFKLYSWGQNNNGQLGIGNRSNSRIPALTQGNRDWVKISGGEFHAIGLTKNGEIYTWGRNNYGQMGIGRKSFRPTPIPTKVGMKNNWANISSGYHYCLAVNTNGELYSWGQNNYGQLGLGNDSLQESPQKTSLSGVNQISAGAYHSFAILENGDVYCWGRNQDGQLGIGNDDLSKLESPRKNTFLSKKTIMISCGDYFTLSINGTPVSPRPDIPDDSPIELQSIVVIENGNKITIGWEGMNLSGKRVRVSLRSLDGTQLINKIYQSNQTSDEYLINKSGFSEFLLDLTLLENNTPIQNYKTKFATKRL